MGKGVPVPELAKECHSDDGARVPTPRTALQTDRNIPSSCVDQTLAKGRAEPRHRILVLVRDNLSIQRSDGDHRGRSSFGLLDQYHTERDERPLADKINAILGHWF